MSCGWAPCSENASTGPFPAAVPWMVRPLIPRSADTARAAAPLVRGDRLPVRAFQPVDGRAQADRLDDRRRAGLETVRRRIVGDPVAGHRFDHLAPALEGRQGLQLGALAIEHADAGRAVELVAGERHSNPRPARARRPPYSRPPGSHPAAHPRRRHAPSDKRASHPARCPARSTCASAPAASFLRQLLAQGSPCRASRPAAPRPTSAPRPCARAGSATARCWSDAP